MYVTCYLLITLASPEISASLLMCKLADCDSGHVYKYEDLLNSFYTHQFLAFPGGMTRVVLRTVLLQYSPNNTNTHREGKGVWNATTKR